MNANVELCNDPNGPASCLQVDITFCRPPTKLREGPLSFCSLGGGEVRGVHVTITYDALDLTIQGPLELIRPHCTGDLTGHVQTCLL